MICKKLFCILASLLFLLPPASSFAQSQEILEDSIKNLEQVEIELLNLNDNIVILKKQISLLEQSSSASLIELEKQKELLKRYQDRVLQLSNRYGELLKISRNLKISLDQSITANKVMAGVSVASVSVAVLFIILYANK